MGWLPRTRRGAALNPRSHSPEGSFPRQAAYPVRPAANQALETRENQGNLAPVNSGGRFFCVDKSPASFAASFLANADGFSNHAGILNDCPLFFVQVSNDVEICFDGEGTHELERIPAM